MKISEMIDYLERAKNIIGDGEVYFKAFEDGMDVNALIEDGLAFFDGTVGRTRIYPATIEEYHDCGTIGSLTFFCDRKVS